MIEQWHTLKARYQQLEQREQYLLALVALALLIFLFTSIIYRPLQESLASERAAYYSQTELRNWMQAQVAQLKQQPAKSNASATRGNRTTSVLINQAAAKSSIQISRSQPRGDNQYQIWLDKVTFNQLMIWLHDLQTEYAIHVDSINISRAEEDGQVRVNLTFQDTQ